MTKIFFCACLTLILLSGCQTTSEREALAPGSVTQCPDDRPEMCTEQYDPVCARVDSDTYRTYPNACHACADRTVSGYRAGACEKD